jgi:glycosyltransferase involved in cell wall biosynthesis
MKKVFFYDRTNFNHQRVQDNPIGASEYQFYNSIGTISRYFPEVICFNSTRTTYQLDGITYHPIEEIKLFKFDKEDIFIIQRFYPTDIKIRSAIKNAKTFIWFHDNVNHKIMTDNNGEQASYFEKNPKDFTSHLSFLGHTNVTLIFVSHTQKNNAFEFFNRYIKIGVDRVHVIYNIVYDHQFNNVAPLVDVNWNRLVYASAWTKGILEIINLFERLSSEIPELTLTLLSPGYDYNNYIDYADKLRAIYPSKLNILGPVSKKDLGEIIMNSCAVIAPPFKETFGCVFAESLYLGTPVIASTNSGAVYEIIGTDYIFDYTDEFPIIEKLKYIKYNKIRLNLNEKFLQDANLKLWFEAMGG